MTRAKLFLCGDVMTGRGIDQVLAHPGDPRLHEPFVASAREYVEIAERKSGSIPRHAGPEYVWGDALEELELARPDARIVNLETAVTAAGDAWPGKGIHYRMHPDNALSLTAAAIDCCVLANNHVLDWGYQGLADTLAALRGAGIRVAGAGEDATRAASPAVIDLSQGTRLLVLGYGSPSSGIPPQWKAGRRRAGVNVLDERSNDAAERIAGDVRAAKRPGDLVVASLHWGGNWGYEVTRAQRELAHRLVDESGVDLVHGHSSHHPRPIEVHAGKLILYGCGDFLNDYEGIGGYESFRPDLALMYLAEVDGDSGRLQRLALVPMRIQKFRVNRASDEEANWLARRLTSECSAFGTRVERPPDGTFELRWTA